MLLDNHLKKMREVQVTQSGLVDFGQFFEIQYDVDGAGEVYPDVYDEMEKNKSTDKKGKKGKPGMIEKK